MNSLKEVGLQVSDVIVILDREQGGKANLARLGINVISLTSISQLLNTLADQSKISQQSAADIQEWLSKNQVALESKALETFNNLPQAAAAQPAVVQSIQQRLAASKNAVFKRVLQTVIDKKSNLCISIDETKSERILHFMQLLGQQAVIFKLHADIITNFSGQTSRQMLALAEKHKFLIFEDR